MCSMTSTFKACFPVTFSCESYRDNVGGPHALILYEITKANGKCSFQSGSLPYCSPQIPEATQETHTAASPFHTVILD